MIEKIILDYLNAVEALASAGISVYMETPVDPPAEYILIEKTGSGEENFIQSAVIAVQSYAKSLYRAAEINEIAKAAMKDLITLATVGRVSLNSDYNFTDPSAKQYRYQAVFDVIYKEIEGGSYYGE